MAALSIVILLVLLCDHPIIVALLSLLIIAMAVILGKDMNDRWRNGLEHPDFCVCALRPANYDEGDIVSRIISEFGKDVSIKPSTKPIRGIGKMKPVDLHGHMVYLYHRDYFLFQNASIYFGPVINRSDKSLQKDWILSYMM